ncbi:hypothetical protein IEO21_02788 [Rhodonia placenta]|uniref:VWFA domain-containing protein n=1 Tax=Rhodonia placenta TaxID=104341 RepID=A0A8H7U449_9APHY|nr:hypothetical protein IEO21_02788 [Postia placenta]
MATLYDDARSGSLTLDKLNTYLKAAPDKSIIDKPGGSEQLTPLAGACLGGHLDVVRLLLNNPYRNAGPNAPSINDLTPLYYATRESPATDRAAIVRTLLKAGAAVDATSAYDGHNTPLMNAISQTRDRDVVHELVDYGASLTIKNDNGITAQTLAVRYRMTSDVLPREKRNNTLSLIVHHIISIILYIISIVNSGILNSIFDAVKILFGISGKEDAGLKKEIKDGGSVKAFTGNLKDYVKDQGLDKFFPRNEPFFATLAQKAAALRDDPNTGLNTPNNLKRLIFLSLYQPIIYCDDSGSMAGGDRYEHQREIVSRIAHIATKIVPDGSGVLLRFINHSSPDDMFSAEAIDAAVRAVRPSGGTRLGSVLRDRILEPYLYKILASPNKRLERPLLICTITDGCPTNEEANTFKNEIVKCRDRLRESGFENPGKAVMFLISQIGDDADATRFLDDLNSDDKIRDMLYCTSDRLDRMFLQHKNNERSLEVWLLKLLTQPIMEGMSLPE